MLLYISDSKTMECINFSTMPFGTGLDMDHVCTRLNELIGVDSWFDSFTVQNTMWLPVVEKIVTNLNSERMVCACVGLYPAYVAGILKQAVEINFYVLSNDYLTYENYIENVVSSEQCIVCAVCENDNFTLSLGEQSVLLKFETRIVDCKLPAIITFAYDMSSEVLTSKHDCLYGQRTTYCKWFKRIYYEDYNYLKTDTKTVSWL